MTRLRWRNIHRSSWAAPDRDGGRYTIDRWNATWSMHYIPAGWPDVHTEEPRRVDWADGVAHTLAMAKASCQADLNERQCPPVVP